MLIINEKSPLKNQHSNIPSFHYSMCEAEDQASKNSFVLNKLYNFRDVKIVAALSVSGPAVRLRKEKTWALKPRAIETSVEISERFGFIHEGR